MVTTMLIKIRKAHDIFSSEITPESVYKERRKFLKKSGYYALAGLGFAMAGCSDESKVNAATEPVAGDWASSQFSPPGWLDQKVKGFNKSQYQIEESLTPFNDVTGYNNFYEFGAGKTDPAKNARHFKTNPWSVAIEGEVDKPGTYTLEDLLKPHSMEERIYRLRCVEAWSMVIPWIGFPLGDLLKRFQPTSKAKFVEFTTLLDPEQMPGQNNRLGSIDWPYVEGLRIDEAMHPLTLLAVGLYGQVLPNQNGAPLRLVIPWKYGFKSIKSIVKIRLLERQPKTTWEIAGPSEYGFYANVNPAVDHPRWSQKTERRLPNTLLNSNRIETRMFNGYEEEVADLYKGMDLRKYF